MRRNPIFSVPLSKRYKIMRRHILIYIICVCATTCAFSQTLSDYLPAARSGNSTAQFNAAQCYLHGWGTEHNPTEWLHYLRLSAEGGEKRAQQALADHYRTLAPELASYWASGRTSSPNIHYHSLNDGCYYGELLGGMRDGCGTYAWDNGTLYLGAWESGERHGMGATYFDNQHIYGTHRNGQMEGYGAIIVTAEGCWLNGAEGSVFYVGYFEDGVPNGTGTLYDTEGRVTYYGTFKAGKPTAQYPSVESYNAYRWTREVLPNGDSWEGESFEGIREGFGIYRWADGAWWCGFWNEGLRDGDGLFVGSEGTIMTGTWTDGEFEN